MYLETILLLKQKKGQVRSVDIVEELGYAKSSVSRAVNLLSKNGYILISSGGDITLTEQGQKKAADIYERHGAITELLMRIGANEDIAEENACRIEHVITAELFELVKSYLEKNK
jgi:Mn-dependent DtxR family transcriptional regulator